MHVKWMSRVRGSLSDDVSESDRKIVVKRLKSLSNLSGYDSVSLQRIADLPRPRSETARPQCRRDGLRYTSELTDAEYALIDPLIPPPKRRGRPRGHDLREVITVLLDMASTGCQWRELPKIPVRLIVHAASIQDRGGAVAVLSAIRNRFPWLGQVFADSGYVAEKFRNALRRAWRVDHRDCQTLGRRRGLRSGFRALGG